MKKTVIVGASPNSSRYAYLAAEMLTEHGHEIVPLGIRKGQVFGKEILDIQTKPMIENVNTITLYVGPQRQPPHIDYLLSLKPVRIIFNPGTENTEFAGRAEARGIEVEEACTLVLLRTGEY